MKRLLVAAMLVLAGCGTGPAAGQGAHGYRLVVEKLGGTQVSIVQVDTAAMPGFIGNLIGKPADTAYTKATAADPSTVTVAVVNAAGVSQLATRNSAGVPPPSPSRSPTMFGTLKSVNSVL